MVMLIFSSGIILYNSLFCSPEAAFLLTTPVRTQRIYQHKFQEAVWFSSWGFVLLGSPTLGGLRRGVAGAVVLLRAAVAVYYFVCPHSGGDWGDFVLADCAIACRRFVSMLWHWAVIWWPWVD